MFRPEILLGCMLCPEPATPKPVSIDDEYGCDDATGAELMKRTILFDDGSVTVEYFLPDGVTPMTSTGFTAKAAPAPVAQDVYDTLPTGVVERAVRYTSFNSAGAPDAMTYTEIDSVTAYVPAGTVALKPQKVQMGSEDLTVTGASIGLASIPTAANSKGQNFPQHALIHVHVDSADVAAGIAYTTDGTAPAEAHEFERSEGQPIVLDTHEEIVNFLAAPLDANGDIDAAATIEITVEYNNISEDKDDV